jgi:hypothetical protein
MTSDKTLVVAGQVVDAGHMTHHGTRSDEAGMDAPQLRSLQIDDVAPVELAPGCTRRGLPSSGQVLVRVIDMDPGTRWPVVDRHDRDELIYIASGEVIEGSQRYGAGNYLYYQPGTHHQPYTETGVRMFIVGPATPAEPGEATGTA